MPASINNKLLTKYMRNGQPTESCPCAIVLQSGRACGGNHSAQVEAISLVLSRAWGLCSSDHTKKDQATKSERSRSERCEYVQ